MTKSECRIHFKSNAYHEASDRWIEIVSGTTKKSYASTVPNYAFRGEYAKAMLDVRYATPLINYDKT